MSFRNKDCTFPHSGICNLAITVLYLLDWQIKNLNLLIFLSRGNKLFFSFRFLFLLYQIVQFHCNSSFLFQSLEITLVPYRLSKVILFCHLVIYAQNNMLFTKQLGTSEGLVTSVISLKSWSLYIFSSIKPTNKRLHHVLY